MNIFKFGGASLQTPDRIRQVANIIKSQKEKNLLVVVSAMGKTTNALEQVVNNAFAKKEFCHELGEIKKYHSEQAHLLGVLAAVEGELSRVFNQITQVANQVGEYDFIYDQIVAQGEIASSIILSHYLRSIGVPVHWADARKYIKTNNSYREAKVNWRDTEKHTELLKNQELTVTQGFIGSTTENFTTTLGRDGSDFSAGIFGFCLHAKSVTIWKDVPGVMSADPKRRENATVFEELPYKEAAEMTYFGASVIHPKTIKPLANRGIPLFVKSFADPTLPGTKIHECKIDKLPPLIVYKENQCLISCKVTDYTFVDEPQLAIIFKAINDHNIRIHVMQNSAISFSFCVDYRESKVMKLIDDLSQHFEVYFNTHLTLITIKNYDAKTSSEFRNMVGVILEQSSRSTLQVLVKAS
ncbi:MAG: aspartate kinase [Flammeovirgaceae bacterium]